MAVSSKAGALLVCVWLACLSSVPAAADVGEAAVFARVDETPDGEPRALQTSIVSYAASGGPDGLRVDLIGAVHIGDKGYYAELNQRFKDYDAVLFEMVAPDGASVPQADAARRGILSNAQLAMRSALGLSFQLDEVDYAAENFVHADLSPEELRQSMDERGESLYVYFWRAFYASIREASRDPLGLRDWQLLSTMLFTEDESALKKTIAYEMTRVDTVTSFLDGEDGSALISARNQRALAVLKEHADAGKRRIAIFYGVAHMPDFEQRLGSEFGLVRGRELWIDAWRLHDDPAPVFR